MRYIVVPGAASCIYSGPSNKMFAAKRSHVGLTEVSPTHSLLKGLRYAGWHTQWDEISSVDVFLFS